MHSFDLKEISLSLFCKDVVIVLKTESESSKQYETKVSGKLVARIWAKAASDNQTVVAITILSNLFGEINLPSEDILRIAELDDSEKVT